MPSDARPMIRSTSANCQDINLNKTAKVDTARPKYFNLFNVLSVISIRNNQKIIAERKGFEPSIRFWRIHTFQACAFDHSATSLVSFFKRGQINKKMFTCESKTLLIFG